MQVSVRFFASLREKVGADQLDIELPQGATAQHLFDTLIDRHPELGGFSSAITFAINAEYAKPGTTLTDGDEVALIPPISGG